MPDVICNTSPLQYLHQADVIPSSDKCASRKRWRRSCETGRRRNVRLPVLEELSWLIVRPVRDPTLLPLVTHLGDGEKEVLALGLETQDPLLLLDDRDARRYARALELEVSGHPRPLVASQGARRSRRGSARFGSSPIPAVSAERQDSSGVLEPAGETT